MDVCLSCPLLKVSQVFSLKISSAKFVASYLAIKPILLIHWGKKCETCSDGIQLVWQSSQCVVPMKLAICTWELYFEYTQFIGVKDTDNDTNLILLLNVCASLEKK